MTNRLSVNILLGIVFILVNTVFAAPPKLDIKANGSNNPNTLTPSDTISLKIELHSGEKTGQNADWWLWADTPFGQYYYDVYKGGFWFPGLFVSYQGELFDLDPFEVLNTSNLPLGIYNVYFQVDTDMDGTKGDQIYTDNVVVNVNDSRPTIPSVLKVTKIWDKATHNAFTDLIRFRNKWYCTFRESNAHVYGENGKIRIITSEDGNQWKSSALLAESGIDLRDPKLSITPDGKLMLILLASVYEGQKLVTFHTRVAFSEDGQEWTPPQQVLDDEELLWRVTWHQNRAYGVSFLRDFSRLNLYSSDDGLNYELLNTLNVPRGNETTLRFMSNGDMIALVRRAGENAWIGTSRLPYTDWQWYQTEYRVGGPNLIILPNDEMWAASREYFEDGKMTTILARFGPQTYSPVLTLPSGGDTSYPGLVFYDDLLWVSYYSSHEGEVSIYLAQIILP